MTDDFFSDLIDERHDRPSREPEFLMLAAVQYAIRTNIQIVSVLTRDSVMSKSVLLPRQLIQILTNAYKDYEPRHPDMGEATATYLAGTVRPIDLYLRGILHGIEMAIVEEVRTLESIKQDCMDAMKASPIRRGEQARLQRLINEVADAQGVEDRETRRAVAFSAIRMFAMSGNDARNLADGHWGALVEGMIVGIDRAHAQGMEISLGYVKRDASRELQTARGNDVMQTVVTTTKARMFPSDDEGLFAWALRACEEAKAGDCSPQQAHAIECMMSSYALPLVLVTTKGMFDLACEADWMSEAEVIRRLASAMYDHMAGRSQAQGGLWNIKSMVQFDTAKGLSSDLVSVLFFGLYWMGGFGSVTIGWMWDYHKIQQHREFMSGERDYRALKISHSRDTWDGYDQGWKAGEREKIRIHRLTTTRQLHAIQEEFTNRVLPLVEKFDPTGYPVLFLYLPVATPDMPWLLS